MCSRSVNPSGVSLRHPDASLCCPGMSWGHSAALQVVTEEYLEVIHKQCNVSLVSCGIPIIRRVIRDVSVNHSLFIPPPQTPRSTTDLWKFPYMEPWPISMGDPLNCNWPLPVDLVLLIQSHVNSIICHCYFCILDSVNNTTEVTVSVFAVCNLC